MQRLTIVYGIITVILVSAIIFLGFSWINTLIDLKTQSEIAKTQQLNIKVVDFLQLFISKVLKNEKEIIFEERLQLENAVLDLKDQEILDQWHKFTKSENEVDAQRATIDLLHLLVRKIEG